MKVLVLGGTGAMGDSLVKLLAEKGNEVIVTSRNKYQDTKNISYIQGNARDISFLKIILEDYYDAVVDFMIYTINEWQERYELLLASTKHYIFLSSSRVYADSKEDLNEESPRLLDVCKDKKYLKTNEYALIKARQENILLNCGSKNWTIIRPYITYNTNRLQLGLLEKELWLYRALEGRSIVFSEKIGKQFTTLTYGYDVANSIIKIIGKSQAFGECIQISTIESVRWRDILNIYLDAIEHEIGFRPKVFLLDYEEGLTDLLGNKYQYKYDRVYNRKFDVEKLQNICGEQLHFCELRVGLEKCLREFVANNGQFSNINWKFEGYADRVCGENTNIKLITGVKNKVNYCIFRHLPITLLNRILCIRRFLKRNK